VYRSAGRERRKPSMCNTGWNILSTCGSFLVSPTAHRGGRDVQGGGDVQFTPLWIRFFQCRSGRYLGCIGLVKSLVFGAVCFDMLFSCDVHRAVWSRDDGLNFPVSRDFCNFSLLFLTQPSPPPLQFGYSMYAFSRIQATGHVYPGLRTCVSPHNFM